MTTIAEIQRVVADYHNMTVADLQRHNQSWTYVRPRQIAMFLARHMTDSSYPKIGASFNRDHTTVISGVRHITRCIRNEPATAALVTKLRRRVGGIPEPLVFI